MAADTCLVCGISIARRPDGSLDALHDQNDGTYPYDTQACVEKNRGAPITIQLRSAGGDYGGQE